MFDFSQKKPAAQLFLDPATGVVVHSQE
jgi:hypothetical protein